MTLEQLSALTIRRALPGGPTLPPDGSGQPRLLRPVRDLIRQIHKGESPRETFRENKGRYLRLWKLGKRIADGAQLLSLGGIPKETPARAAAAKPSGRFIGNGS